MAEESVAAWTGVRALVIEKIGDGNGGNSGRRKRSIESVTGAQEEGERKRIVRRSGRSAGGKSYVDVVHISDSENEVVADETYQDEDDAPETDATGARLVSCPSCTRRMKEELVFSHLDTCTGPPKPRPIPTTTSTSTSSIPITTHPINPLPYLNYDIMKERDLKNKLNHLGIPSHGTKSQMGKRHKQWVNIWNSNCDASRPASKMVLLRQLNVWEKAHGNLPTQQREGSSREWNEAHRDQFRELIERANARSRGREANGEVQGTEGVGDDGLDGTDAVVVANGVGGDDVESMVVSSATAVGVDLETRPGVS